MRFDKKRLSPMAIADELQQVVQEMNEDSSWNNYFEGGAGRTIIELIAGSQAIKNHYNLMRVREGSLQYAKLDSSITELAINKGVYRPPAKNIRLEITFKAISTGSIAPRTIVGQYKNYDVIICSPVEFRLGETATACATIGHVEEATFLDLPDAKEFQEFIIEGKHKYFGDELQELVLNNEELLLVDEELNLYDEDLYRSVVRLTYEYFTRLYFGDGIIGKKLGVGDNLTFRYNTFGDDLLERFNSSQISLGAMTQASEIIDVKVLRKATMYLDKEKLRKIAIRNSVDGRWVQVQDYENGLIREYGQYIYDVLVKDEYPAENITILPREDYISETVKDEIIELINNKRGNATLINITWLDPYNDQRLELSFNFEYKGTDSNEFLDEMIAKYVETRLNKIRYSSYILTGADLAVELTHLSPGGKFYATLEESEVIEPLNSIKSLTLNYIR